MLIFRQLFDPVSSTYTYLLADDASREAIFIDPVFEQARRDAALINELNLSLVATVETHIHADHVTAAWLHKRDLGSESMISAASEATCADRHLVDYDKITFGNRYVEVRATPGHTNGCLTYVLDDESMAFTGDCLLIRGSGRTDFQQGEPRELYRSVHTKIFTLPDTCLLYPGHDYRGLSVTSVHEERAFNPRLGGQIAEQDFVGYMANLNLAHPRLLDIAVPANLKCGRPDDHAETPEAQTWATLKYTFAGIWEIEPQALEEAVEQPLLLDVREKEEFDGPLGYISGSKLIPLGELSEHIDQLPTDQPIVIICRSGARSAQAAVMLQKAKFSNVANLAGGILRWRGAGYPVENGSV